MDGIIVFIIFVILIPMLLTIGQFSQKMNVRKRLMIGINLLVWLYELFFFLAVCGAFPHAQVYFGGGLGDLLFFGILILLFGGHIIALCIMSYKATLPVLFIIPLIVVVIPLIGLHQTAARGDKYNDYMTGGNWTGLYYDKLARDLERDTTLPPTFTTRFETILYNAEQGDAESQVAVGIRYMEGDSIEKNDTLALQWFRAAAKQGNAEAQAKLGEFYYDGKGGVAIDHAEAILWLRKAAENEHPETQYMQGSTTTSAKRLICSMKHFIGYARRRERTTRRLKNYSKAFTNNGNRFFLPRNILYFSYFGNL